MATAQIEQKFFAYGDVLGLNKNALRSRASLRFGRPFEELLDEDIDSLIVALAKKIKDEGKEEPIDLDPDPPEDGTITPDSIITIEALTHTEVLNMFKPCDHDWVVLPHEDPDNTSYLVECSECIICGGVRIREFPDKSRSCTHKYRVMSKSKTKLLSLCVNCHEWLIEPMKSA